MNKTPYEKGLERGILLGLRSTLKVYLEAKFGEPSDQTLQRVELSSADELETLFKRLVRANSLQELGLVD